MNQAHRYSRFVEQNYGVAAAAVYPSSQAPDIDRKTNDLKFSLLIENYTDREIIIGTRNGILYRIKPAHRRGDTKIGIYIKQGIEVNQGTVEFDAQTLLNNPRTPEHQAMRDAEERNKPQRSQQRMNLDYYFFISYEDIDKSGGLLYCPEVDMIFSNLLPTATILHPFSEKGLQYYDMLASDYLIDMELAGVGIRLVDNTLSIKFKYVNFAGRVVRIPARVDVTRPNGLYISINGCTKSGDNLTHPHYTEFIPVDEFDKHNKFIFDSFTDAKTLGDQFKQRDEEFKERELTLRHKDLELTELKRQHAADESIRKEELAKEQHARTIALMDQQSSLKQKEIDLHRLKQEHDEETARIKRTNERRKEDLDMQTQELERQKQTADFDQKMRDMKNEELRKTLEEDRKREDDRRKRHAAEEEDRRKRRSFERERRGEEESHARKTTYEILKMIPAVIGIIVSIIAIQKSSKK